MAAKARSGILTSAIDPRRGRRASKDGLRINSAEIQGFGLSMLNKFASSEWPDKLKVRKPFEKLIYNGSKTGFRVLGTLARKFEQNGAAKLETKERLPP